MSGTDRDSGEQSCVRPWFTYIVRCRDGSLYTGSTVGSVEARVAAHNEGRGARYTRSRRPVELVWYRTWDNAHDARSMEGIIKHWKKEEKEALVRNGRMQGKE